MDMKENEMVNTPKSPGKIAFQEGLLFGIIVAVIVIVLNSIVNLTGLSTTLTFTFNRTGHMSLNQAAQMANFLVSAPAYVISIIFYFVAGWRASKLAGKVISGALAGLWTGLVKGILIGIIDIAIFLLVTLPAIDSEYSKSHLPVSSSYTGSLLGYTVINNFTALLTALILGAGIGALGGLMGKDQNVKNGEEVSRQKQPAPSSAQGASDMVK